jgi:hypothetical protein
MRRYLIQSCKKELSVWEYLLSNWEFELSSWESMLSAWESMNIQLGRSRKTLPTTGFAVLFLGKTICILRITVDGCNRAASESGERRLRVHLEQQLAGMYLNCIYTVSGMFSNKRRYKQVTKKIHTNYVLLTFKNILNT